MSWQKTTFNELQAQALTILADNDQPILQHIDLYNSEPEYLKEELAFDFPVLLIDFSETTWKNQGRNQKVQVGKGLLRLILGQVFYSDSYHNSINQDEKLQRFNLLQAVYKAFHCLTGTHFKNLFRSKTEMDNNHSNVIWDVLEFDWELCDDSATQPIVKLPAPTKLHINANYDNQEVIDAGILFDRMTQPDLMNLHENNQ